MKFKKITIIGMGLIGGSLGKAVLEKGLAEEVIGVCRRESSLDRATCEKACTKGYVNNYKEATEGADLIVIATPVYTIEKVMDGLSEEISEKGVLVTDVGSTKREIVEYAKKYKDKFNFVGGHPLAGSEKAGVEHSRADLFEGSVCILTEEKDTSKEDIEKLKDFWESVGATVKVLSPQDHDEALAFSSHLPHIVASTLSGIMKDRRPYSIFATGFEDTTRIASSDSDLWCDIFMSNKENVRKSITEFKGFLAEMEDAIKEGRSDDLKNNLERGKKTREAIIEELNAIRKEKK